MNIATNWRLEVELAGIGGGWSEISRDVLLAAGVKVGYGMRGNWPTELVASIGTLLCSLNNSEANSQGILGLYTLGRPACRGGFAYGIRFRFVLGGTVRFMGRLDSAPATPGIYGPRDVRCRVVDYMDELTKQVLRGIPTQTGLTATEVVTAILDAMPIQPASRSIASCSDIYGYVFDQVGKAGEEIQSVTQSEMGRFFDLGGVATLEGRNARRNKERLFTLYNSPYVDFDPGSSYQRDNVKTRAEITVHPREVGGASVVLASYQDKTFLGPGQSITVVMRYVDPDQRAANVGGADMTDPITDYSANTRADGAGASMYGALSITPDFGGQEATLVLLNTDGTTGFFVTGLNLWGTPVRDLEPVKCSSVADDADLELYGDNPVTIDMKYQGSAIFGQAVADGIRSFMGTPRLWDGKFSFCANATQELMDLAVTANISTCFEYHEGITGKSTWIINAVDLEIDRNNHLWVTWYCEPADLTHYWMPGQDLLGATTIPAPF